MRTTIDLQFADGAYTFKLGLAQIRELQDKTKSGIGEMYARVLAGRVGDDLEIGHPIYAKYRLDDLRETVRQGLIGGAAGRVDGADVVVSSFRATELVERYLDPMPLSQQWTLAAAVLYALVEGYADDETEKEAAAAAEGDEDKKKADGSTIPPP